METAPVVHGSEFNPFKIAGRSRWLTLFVLPLVAALSGCVGEFKSVPSVETGETVKIPIGNLSGAVYGGQSPIWQSHVYLMKATTAGYGQPSQSLLTSTGGNTTADTTVLGTTANPAYYVTTDSSGNFNITGDYTCTYNATTPSQSDQLYLVSLSGNATFVPGNPPTNGSTNPLIGLMSVLGQCPSNGTFAGHLNYIIMNEVSTAATAYALAGFASNSYTISSGSSAQAKVGLANAMANANQIYDIQNLSNGSTHEARTTTPNGNGTVPQALVDTIANILASCINLSNATTTAPTTGNCYKLNSNTGSPGSGYNNTSAPGSYNVTSESNSNNGSTGNTVTYTTTSTNTLYAGEWVNVTGNPSISNGFNNYGVVLAGPTSTQFQIFVPYGQNSGLASGVGNYSQTGLTGVTATVGTDTASAAIYIAQHPASNVAALYALQTAGTVQFSDDLSSVPNDFSLGISYSSGGSTAFNQTTGVCFDSAGDAYVTTQGNTTSIFKLNPLGVPISPFPVGTGTGYYCSVDTSGNVWAPLSSGNGGVMEYTSAGVAVTGSPYTDLLTINTPYGIANDGSGNGYVANFNGTVLGASSTGDVIKIVPGTIPTYTTISSVTGTTNNLQGTYLTSVDQASDVWTIGLNSNKVARFSSAGVAAFTPETVGSLTLPIGLAIDSNSNAWVSFASSTTTLAKITTTGSSTQYTGGGLNGPRLVAIDGANNVFVSNQSGSSVSEFNSAGTAITGTTGYNAGGVFNNAVGLAVDPSGDVWATNYGGNTVVEFIGLGVPVVTPIAGFIGVAANSTGNKP